MSAKTHNYMTDDGVKQFVLHSDYATLEGRHDALEERIRRINVWHECDKCDCLFIPGGLGAETSCATCIKRELDALREAVAWMCDVDDAWRVSCDRETDDAWVESQTSFAKARAEVDRLIAEGHAE